MKKDKLSAKKLTHPRRIASMTPVRIVDSSEGDALLFAFESRELHVRGVDRVHVIWRESRILLLLVYGLRVKILRKCYLLDYCLQHVLLSQVLVGLDAGQAERRLPLDWISGCGHDPGTFGEPFFDIIGILE